jgi:hypothetical protein
MIKKVAFNIEKNSIMNIYLQRNRRTKRSGTKSKPIDGAELLSVIIAQIKDLITQIAKSL